MATGGALSHEHLHLLRGHIFDRKTPSGMYLTLIFLNVLSYLEILHENRRSYFDKTTFYLISSFFSFLLSSVEIQYQTML